MSTPDTTLAPELRPDHAISQVRFLGNDMLDALRQDFVELHRPFPPMIIGRAPRHA
jgi:hypothetical protein